VTPRCPHRCWSRASIWTVKALADFFGQPIDYFTDPAAAPVTAQTRRSSRMALLLSLIRDPDDQTLDLARLAREAEAIGAHVTEDDLRAVRDGSVASLPVTRTDELARYFGLPPAALAEEIAGHTWAEQLPESHVLADEGVRKIAFRAHALSPADREIINRLLDRLSREEGLSPDDLPF